MLVILTDMSSYAEALREVLGFFSAGVRLLNLLSNTNNFFCLITVDDPFFESEISAENPFFESEISVENPFIEVI